MTAAKDYSASQIKTLSDAEHAQRRVSLYLGGDDDAGGGPLNVACREIFDNSVDEVRGGHGDHVEITFHSDGSVQVIDNGRGIPADKNADGESGIYLALGKTNSGGKFGDESSYTNSAGLNGIGAAVVAMLSKLLVVKVYRGGKEHVLMFKNGMPGHAADENDPDSKFTEGDVVKVRKDPRPAAQKKSHPTGTNIRYWINPEFFSKGSKLDVPKLLPLIKFTSYLVPGITIVLNDYRDNREESIAERTVYKQEGGILDLLEHESPDQKLHEPVYIEGEGSYMTTTPVRQKDGSLKQQEVERRIPISLALGWGTGYETTGRAFVNTIYTPLGGTHVRGLERALSRALGDKIGSTRGLLKAKDEPPILDDMLEGLTYVLSIQQPEPDFVGQDKQRLGTRQMTAVVQRVVEEQLSKWLEQRKNADQVKLILQKVVNASHNRQAAKAQKDANRRKTALKASSMPAKLVDCSDGGNEYTELHIVEGDSALGSLRLSRDSRYQALLPIRGKILNTHGKRAAEVLKNSEVADITQVLGAGFGKDFDVDDLRYHKCILTADADSDGSHIRVLLITLFWNWMRPLIEEGRLYSSVPPLYSVKVKGKGNETIYVLDDDELEKVKRRLKNKSYKVSRFKGLGEMTSDEVVPMIDPKERTLRQITVDDAKEAERILELAMGNQVEPRRDWIMMSRDMIDIEDLG